MQQTTTPSVLSASTITGFKVTNVDGEYLGKVEDIMLDVHHGRVAYAVLSFGGVLGIGDKLFAVPWEILDVGLPSGYATLNVPRERLEAAPGFDKDHWPEMADSRWLHEVYDYYETPYYW